MKKLLMILAACATAMVASAAVKTQVDFESGLGGFTGSGYEIKDYPDATKPGQPYPFSGDNDKYCAVDADSEDKLTGPTESGATCFDMYVQFPVGATTPDTDSLALGENAKVAVYLDYNGNKVCVVHGNSSGGTDTTTTETTVAPGAWVRLTIAKVVGGYNVYINGVDVNGDAVFTAISSDTAPTKVDFAGCGNLDNYVARTGDPFTSTYEASFGTGRDIVKYASYSEAFAEVLASGATMEFTVNDETPRTVNGTTNPYEITCLADLTAFQEAVADKKGLDKCYVQTADIALTEAWPGIGVQNGKDLVNYTVGTASGNITQEEAARRDAKWSAGAFKGTYDGGNYTISNFQMVGVAGNPDSTTEGLDYCGFFNSVDGATIKNLKIAYAGSLFATDTTASTKESGATFVGVATNSTLRNLTSLAGTVSCSKGFGGIVGYLMAGSTVDSCTNNVNLQSLANNKVGGIAMICQQKGCSITDCENNGTTTTTSGEHGGIVGYTDTITIDGCVNTAAYKMFYHHGGTVTLSGTNKGNATVASYTGVATPGLNFATVDGNVATFVANDILAAGNTYKVMAAGATATATLANEGDTISFDTALVNTESAKPTFNITAGAGLVAKSSTSGTVTTYTADEGYEVVSTAETTLVSVPKNCYAAELIDLSNRAAGDVLKVYSKDDSDKCYYTWTLSSEKAWMPAVTYKVSETDSTSHSKPASEVQLYAGQAAWLTRTDTSKDILLAVVAEGDTIPASVEKGWNMIAPAPKAGATTVDLNEVVPAGSATDQIKIPTAGAPITCTYENEKWGYYKFIKDDKGRVTGKEWVSDVTIDAGTGFWYISDSEKTVNLK